MAHLSNMLFLAVKVLAKHSLFLLILFFFLLIIHETIHAILFHVSAAAFVSRANGHFDCDSRLIATFRRVFVLPGNLLMKYRLFGDLETIQHNRQRHNERFPPSPPFFYSGGGFAATEKGWDAKTTSSARWKKSPLFHSQSVQREVSTAPDFYKAQDQQTVVQTNHVIKLYFLFLHFKVIPFKGLFVCFYIAHLLRKETKLKENRGRNVFFSAP